MSSLFFTSLSHFDSLGLSDEDLLFIVDHKLCVDGFVLQLSDPVVHLFALANVAEFPSYEELASRGDYAGFPPLR